MAFKPQQINPLDFDNSKAIGVNLPFKGSAVFTSNYQTKDAIKNNLINFFLTDPGERFLNPTFGSGLREFIFEQITSNNLEFLKKDISTKIELYFPNVSIQELKISANPNFSLVNVNFTYKILNTNTTDEITITL